MTIELWYDPVYTEIKTKINGKWQNHKDIFVFLYPVRHYPLQTWLREAGSWIGLGRQIYDLARGEDVTLTFHGRQLDYQDLENALNDYHRIQLCYQFWDAEEFYNQRINSAIGYIQAHPFPIEKEQETLESILDISDGKDAWVQYINADTDWAEAETSTRPCIVVGENYPITFDTLHRLERLTRSLRRPSEAICCLFQDVNQLKIAQDYAAQFQGLQFSFFPAEDSLNQVNEKYGVPYCLRRKVEMLSEIPPKLEVFFEKQENQDRKADLLFKSQNSHLTLEEQLELANLQAISGWIFSSFGWLTELKSIKSCHAIDTLKEGAEQ